MNIKKFCKIYVGIGMVYAGTMFASIKKKNKEEFDKVSIETKINVFAEEVLSWPVFAARLAKAFAKGLKAGYKHRKELKESTNESDT